MIDAAFDILQEGMTVPTVEQVADRAGVSVASVYRYVDSLSGLRLHAFERFLERFRHLLDIDVDASATRAQRVAQLVATRQELYERAGSIMQLGWLRALEDDRIVTASGAMRSMLAEQVRRSLAPELSQLTPEARADLLAVVDGLTSLGAWVTMHEIHGRSHAQIRRAWERAVGAQLDAARFTEPTRTEPTRNRGKVPT